MNDFTSDNQTEDGFIRQKLSRLVRRYSFPEKVSLAQEYQLPPGVLAWLDKTASEVSQGKPDAACKSLHDEKDADVKLIAEKLIALIFTDSRNTSHEQQGLEKKFREMRDFIASDLCVHYAEDTIKFLLSHGANLEFMKDTDAFLISEGLSGHELASALKAILEDKSLGISANQQLYLRAIAEKAEKSAVQIKRVGSKNLEIPKVPEVNSRPSDEDPMELERQVIEHAIKIALSPTAPVYNLADHRTRAHWLNQDISKVYDLRANLIRLAKKEGWIDVERELTRLFEHPPVLIQRPAYSDSFFTKPTKSDYTLALQMEADEHDYLIARSVAHQIELYLDPQKAMLEKPENRPFTDILRNTVKRFPFREFPTPPKPAPDAKILPRAAEIKPLPKDAPPPIPDREPTSSPAAPLHQGKAPPGAETILTAQQAGIGIADFRIRPVVSDGFFSKAQYTAIFRSSEYSEAIVKHAFPEAKRSTKWSSKSEPPAMLVSGKISPGEVRESLSKSLSAFRLDQKTNKVSFQR